ncbi:MAG: FixH family protein [Nitrospirae bacterium]|nr:FixH family protein [Nitrospirota bacterium]
MKHTIVTGIAILALFSVSFAHSGRHEGSAKFTKHFNETLFAISDLGQVSIEVLLDEKEYKIGRDMIGIVIHDSHDEDVEDAKVIVTVTDRTEPLKVTEKGEGLYLVPNTGLPKDGAWKLSISVKKKKVEDGAAFAFPEVLTNRMPAGKYDAGLLKPQKTH